MRNQEWNEFDKGLVSTEEIITIFAENAPQYKNEIAKIYEHIGDIVSLYDYAIPWIEELKEKGYKVYILSNWSKPAYDANLDTNLRFLPMVDGAVMSFQEHIIKPNPEIYQLICNRYGICPQEAVFLDDNLGNITSAQAFGLHTIHFQGYKQAREELEGYLCVGK